MGKPRILFVGAFKPSADGTRGGQLLACSTLIESSLSEAVDWVLIDSTASTNRGRSFLQRLLGAGIRLLKFLYYLVFGQVDTVLLFCSSGYSFREKGLMAIWAKRFGKRVILAPRSGLIINDIEGSDKFRNIVIRVLNHVDTLICQGPSWESYYRKISVNQDLTYAVVHNWIDLRQLEQRVAPSETSPFNVVFLGWITGNKGVFDILEAAKKLKHLPLVFKLGGHGDSFEELNALIASKALLQVELPGWVIGQDKTALLNQADIFILPSYREGYPNALIEAMAYGIPVVATKVGSVPDLIQDGVNGFLIDPGQPEQLAEKIKHLYDNPELRQKMGAAARERVQTNNDLQIAVNKLRLLLVPSSGAEQ